MGFFMKKYYNGYIGYKFYSAPNFQIKLLSEGEISVIDKVIKHFGDYNTKQIVERMHGEEAHGETGKNRLISYEYAESLSI